jgi:hypothetical protein
VEAVGAVEVEAEAGEQVAAEVVAAGPEVKVRSC